MTVKEYLALQQCDYDFGDTTYDAVVTCCYNDEIEDNYDKFCDLLVSKVNLVRGGDYPVANWTEFIEKNFEKFQTFARKYWKNSYEDDRDEFIYQWIREFHCYHAGMVGKNFYDILVEFFEELEPVTEQEG